MEIVRPPVFVYIGLGRAESPYVIVFASGHHRVSKIIKVLSSARLGLYRLCRVLLCCPIGFHCIVLR